jgi:hypothetical protein
MGNLARAEKLLNAVPSRWQGFQVQGRNRSPMLDRVEHAGTSASGRMRL